MEVVELEDEESEIHFHFPPATHSGRVIIELKSISKSYGDNLVLKDLDLEIERGDKIGLVGNNGAGKSTLARIIRGTEEFQNGKRKPGTGVEIEYYSQHQADTMDPKNTVLGTIDSIAAGEIRKQLRTILGSFLFKGDDVFKSVSVLSGGEKSRLALARMLLKPSNFLILDEPTNHLDMSSKNILLKALHDYKGSILIISHDREFLDGIVNKIIEVKNRNIKTYFGNCSYYLMKKAEESGLTDQIDVKIINTETKTKKSKEQKRFEAEQRNRLYNIAKPVKDKIHQIEKSIKLNEKRIEEIESLMSTEEFYKDSNNAKTVNAEYKKLKRDLTNLFHDWMEESNKLNQLTMSSE
jgi:ATP-binding cassette subfamily F protein 3